MSKNLVRRMSLAALVIIAAAFTVALSCPAVAAANTKLPDQCNVVEVSQQSPTGTFTTVVDADVPYIGYTSGGYYSTGSYVSTTMPNVVYTVHATPAKHGYVYTIYATELTSYISSTATGSLQLSTISGGNTILSLIITCGN